MERETEMTLTIFTDATRSPSPKIIYNVSKDLSETGAKIQSNIFLPVNSLINVKYKPDPGSELMTAMGKVRWIRSLFADELFEAGLEFVQAPCKAC
jgi:hypothetical protein